MAAGAATAGCELILHHHDPSPFAEKIRAAFGVKRLAWRSVQIPMVMPKPDLVALTGGYRGTPVLQIGADIYCDSRLIVAEIERRYPQPALLRSGPLVAFGLQHWSDEAVFPPGAALAMHAGGSLLPSELIEDRATYFTDLDFPRFAADAPHHEAQLKAHLSLIEWQLADGRTFLLGDAPDWADLNAYFLVWMVQGHIPNGDSLLAGRTAMLAWRERIAAFGTGERRELEPADALAVARGAALPDEGREAVKVFPVAHPETASSGRLVSRSDDEIVISRRDARAGGLRVHFPTIGYRIEPAL